MQKFSMPPLFSPLKKRLLVLCAAVLLSQLAGCGMARLAYNNGETLSYFWLDRYVDFTDEQQPWVKQEIASVFDWHRRTQLPGYVQFMQGAQQKINRPLQAQDVRNGLADIKARMSLITERALPAMAELAMSLRAEQIAHLERKFAANNDDYRKDKLRGDLEQRQRERFKRMLKQYEYFFGDFSAAQEARMRALSDARPLNNELVLKDRIVRQKAMLAMLRKIQTEKPGKEATIAMLRAYVDNALNYFGNAEHRAFYEAFESSNVQQVTEIINLTTPEQKQHLSRTLQGWIKDFQALGAASGERRRGDSIPLREPAPQS